MDSIQFLYTIYFLSIILNIISLIISIGFVFPLQLKEAKVKNGLFTLRKQMLLAGLTIIIINIASILALTSRFFIQGELNRYITTLLILIHATGLLSFSIIKFKIYRQQYTSRQKTLHNKIAKLDDDTK